MKHKPFNGAYRATTCSLLFNCAISSFKTFQHDLLLTILQKQIKRTLAFSNLATVVPLVLMNYINIFSFLENTEEDWLEIVENPPEKIRVASLFD